MPPLFVAWLALASCAAAQSGANGAEAPRTYLVSLAGVAIGADERVERFQIDTWGIDILAICRIPPGWVIEGGRTAAADGVIRGKATHGITRLDRSAFAGLGGVALVRIDGPVRGGTQRTGAGSEIATFLGQVVVQGPSGREIPLTLENIRLVPARGCPEA